MKADDVRHGMKVRNKISSNTGIVRCFESHDLVEVRVCRIGANPYITLWKISNIEPITKK